MKRLLLACLILVAVIGLVASVWLRMELAAPGVSALTNAVADPRRLFAAAMLAQSVATALWLPLLAALAGLVAGSGPGRIAAGVALMVAGLALGVTVISWTGTPSLAAPALLWFILAPGPQIIGLALGLLSAAALLAGAGWRRTAALTVMSLTVAVLGGILADLLSSPAALALPAAALTGLAALSWRNPAAVWLGSGGAIVTALPARQPGVIDTGAESYVLLQPLSTAVAAFTVFLVLATLAARLRPRLPLWLPLATAAAYALAMTAATSPQLFLGNLAMPRRYVDYADAFALWNLVSTLGAVATLVVALAAAAVILLRRNRAT